MILLWLVVLVVGVAVTAYGSRRAVIGALGIADELGVSTGLVGVTLVAIGTDLPEIANSISASVTGHGDLNVGNATGSALTQVTLIVAILMLAAPTLATADREDEQRIVGPTGALTVAATLAIALFVRDGFLSRADGLFLVAAWIVAMVLVSRWQRTDRTVPAVSRSATDPAVARAAAAVLGWLAVVGVAATAVVQSFVEVTDAIGVPELVASTIVLALGTSLPELVVDWTAVRRGAAALAIGDLFGSSLVDSTLSIGIGPVVRGIEVSTSAVASTVIVAVAVAAATAAWYVRPRRQLPAAALFGGIYVVAMVGIVAVAS